MESLIISYSFFEPKSLHREMRTWDLYNNQDRYWYNIPALMAINSVVYPDTKIKIHISNNIKSNKYFEILEKIADNFDNIELVNLDYDYRETEPTMWRYKPLFDKESDIVLCRDIDSLPNSDEIKATYYFINNSQYYVHTLRTHTNHIIPHTIILAGLCGYRPNKIEFLQNINFEMYYNHFKNGTWGLDQSSLINLFVRDQEWTSQRFLDSPISTNFHKVGYPIIRCVSKNQEVYRSEIDLKIDESILNLLDGETKWAGEPTNFRGEKLERLLEIDNDNFKKMRDILHSCSEEIKNFYL